MDAHRREVVVDYLAWVDAAPRPRVQRARMRAPVDALQDALDDAERDPELRHRYVGALARFAGRDDAASSKLRSVATDDPDELVRTAAFDVLTAGHARGRTALRRIARTRRRRAR